MVLKQLRAEEVASGFSHGHLQGGLQGGGRPFDMVTPTFCSGQPGRPDFGCQHVLKSHAALNIADLSMVQL